MLQTIDQDEAVTVKLAFYMYLLLYSTQEIADRFNKQKRKTFLGNDTWTANSIVTYGEELDDETFVERVGNKSPKQISRLAIERGAGSMYYAQIILEEYNGKRRGSARLSARKLYARTELELELDNEDEVEESDESGQDSMFQELEERSAIAL